MGKLDEGSKGAFSGAAAGASTLSYFGPVGIFAGAVIGGMLGSSAKRKRRKAEARILKANTKQSFDIGESTYANINKARTDAADSYTQNMSAERARFAGSGASLDSDSWTAVQGRLASERDDNLTQIQGEEDKFFNSEAFKFIEKDYKYMSGTDFVDQGGDDYNEYGTWSIRTEGKSGESFFTDKQKKELRTYTGESNQNADGGALGAYQQYQDSITPTQDEYLKGRFGSDDDRRAFESTMDQRIADANTQYDGIVMQRRLDEQRQRDLKDSMSGD